MLFFVLLNVFNDETLTTHHLVVGLERSVQAVRTENIIGMHLSIGQDGNNRDQYRDDFHKLKNIRATFMRMQIPTPGHASSAR